MTEQEITLQRNEDSLFISDRFTGYLSRITGQDPQYIRTCVIPNQTELAKHLCLHFSTFEEAVTVLFGDYLSGDTK